MISACGRERVEEYYARAFFTHAYKFCAEFRLSHCSPPPTQDRRRRRRLRRHRLQRNTSFLNQSSKQWNHQTLGPSREREKQASLSRRKEVVPELIC